MYYFGTNLDARFSVPDFWPPAEQSHTIPFEAEEVREEVLRMNALGRERRERREREARRKEGMGDGLEGALDKLGKGEGAAGEGGDGWEKLKRGMGKGGRGSLGG